MANRIPRYCSWRIPGNRGKGYSVRNGMLHARGDICLFTDADLSSPIAEAQKLFDAIAAGADIAIGSRWLRADLQTERQPLYRQVFGRIYNLVLRIFLGLNFVDTQCGFKAFRREAAQRIFPLQRIERWGFDPEILFLARRLGFSVKEVPVVWAHSEGTRLNPFRDGVRMFGEVLRIRWNSIVGAYATPAVSVPDKIRSDAISRRLRSLRRLNARTPRSSRPSQSVVTVGSVPRARSGVRRPAFSAELTPASTHSASLES